MCVKVSSSHKVAAIHAWQYARSWWSCSHSKEGVGASLAIMWTERDWGSAADTAQVWRWWLFKRGRAIVHSRETDRYMEPLGRRSTSDKLFASARCWNGHLFCRPPTPIFHPPPPRENYPTRAANVWGLSSSRHSQNKKNKTPSAAAPNGGGGGSSGTCGFGRRTPACVRELFTCALR